VIFRCLCLIQNISRSSSDHSVSQMLSCDQPFQPADVSHVVTQTRRVKQKNGKLREKTLTFQRSWFERFPWLHNLHYCPKLNAVLCNFCARAHAMSLLDKYGNTENTFAKDGFRNWNKAANKFQAHEKTACHGFACLQFHQQKAPSVVAQ